MTPPGEVVGPRMATDDIEVRKNDADSLYELLLNGQRVGEADYRELDGAVEMPHTHVDPALNGRGLGGTMVRFALDDIRSAGKRVVPSCPFVSTYIKRHPEYADLL